MTTAFIRDTLVQPLPPPAATTGPLGWARKNLFSSISQTILTLVGAFVAVQMIYAFIDFTLIRAVWTGEDRTACLGERVGACWPFIQAKFGQFMYGFYPVEQRWRVNLTYLVALALLIPLMIPSVPFKRENAIAFFGLFPVFAFSLLVGGSLVDPWLYAFGYLAIIVGAAVALFAIKGLIEKEPTRMMLATGAGVVVGGIALVMLANTSWFDAPRLEVVETRQWGGMLVTLVVAVTGIVCALPIGVALALGRRSKLPIIRFLSVALIEIVRGVPLITVLFFATYMLPLFLERSPDALLRVLVGVSIFAGAYMAEVIRGGLQAIPKGQFEGAMALGLDYTRMMGLIVMPQALKLVIPGIVNTFIGLFKDTTLVSIVAIFDLLGGLRAGFVDPQWATPVTLYTGFAFAGIIYFSFCYFMSRYSIFIENRLNVGRRR